MEGLSLYEVMGRFLPTGKEDGTEISVFLEMCTFKRGNAALRNPCISDSSLVGTMLVGQGL